jgi:hypothetical protein
MNQILDYGNNLYGMITRSISKDFLLLTDVPEFVDIEDDTFCLEYSESFSGALFMYVNNDPYVTLEHAFNEIFFTSSYKSCLLTIGMNTVLQFLCLFLMCLKFLILTHGIFMGCHMHLVMLF